MLDNKDTIEPYQLQPHIKLLNAKVRDLCLGRSEKRGLMVFMPPQHGKSVFCSKYTPAWYESMFPHRHTLLTSYEGEFARGWGRKTRDVCTRWGPEMFGYKIRDDSSAADWWEIAEHGGTMQTAGVGGGISGKPGHLGIIDDPVKNAEEAASPTIHEKHWDWYLSSFKARRQPGYANLLIMTRWNENDLAGKILAHEGDQWEVLRIPALAEEDDPLGRADGAALWPERYDQEYLEGLRDVSPYWFAAMYQGNPQPREGGMFGNWIIVPLHQVPKAERICRYWDLASTKPGKSDPDWTVGVKETYSGGMAWVVDVQRFREEPYGKEERIKQTAAIDGPETPIVIEQEPGSAGKDLITSYQRMLPGFRIIGVRSTGPKELRADLTSAMAANGTLRLVQADWNHAFIDEHRSFPTGAHDDQVDAAAGATNWLTQPTKKRILPPRPSGISSV